MENLVRCLLLVLTGLTFSLRAQNTQSAAAVNVERVTFPGSIKSVVSTGSPTASNPSAVLMRSELNEAEVAATVEFSVALKMRNPTGLQRRIEHGDTIPLDEIAAQYYPTTIDCQKIVDWLTSQGFAVQPLAKYSLSIFARGSVTQIERAFRTKFGRVKFDGVEYSSALVAPSLPALLAGPALGINGLQPHLHLKKHLSVFPGQVQPLIDNRPPYTIGEIAKAYHANGLSVNGSGQKIGIVIDTFPSSSDLTAFWQANGVAQSLNNIEEVHVVSGPLPRPSGEETLDAEWSSGMAPGAKVRIYASTNLQLVNIDQAYQTIINELPSQPALHQISLSFGVRESDIPTNEMETDSQYFATMAGAGVTVFASSGDGGSRPGSDGSEDNTAPPQVQSPANDPNVTGVGGTSLSLNTATGAVDSEIAWSLGGGGTSQFFSRPAWQVGAGIPTGSRRLVPDVALAADPNNGGYLILDGQLDQVGGTSWSAPTWAGFCAIINQARANAGSAATGLLGPRIYPLNETTAFRDIIVGSNGLNGFYNAGPGYDLCTGLGVPNIASLIQAFTTAPAILTVPNPPDFDGDGKQDLLWRNTTSGRVCLWLMNGSAPKAAVLLGAPPLSWGIINTGDFNGDGKSDILWQLANTGQYGVWFMNGAQVASIQNFTLPSYAGQICCVADFDGDGLADLVTLNPAAGVIYFWKNMGFLRFVAQSSYAVSAASGWLPVGTARLNGPSGSPAVIWRNISNGQISAWFMSGFTWSSAASFGNPGNDVVLNGFGDFSGDGRTDLLLFNTSSNVVGYWRSNGALQPSSVALAQVSGTWTPTGAENLDGTGNAEIIWRQSSTGALGAWQVSGSVWSVSIGALLVSPTWQLQPRRFLP